MTIQLYSTLTRSKVELKPRDEQNVRMYVCGPTVYDLAHIGNARPVVVFDVLYRLLRHEYGEGHVKYVRNITDVDDKIIAAAKASGEHISDLTTRTAKAFHEDMAALKVIELKAENEPRATQYIKQMKNMIARLIERGHAYVAEDHVLFSVPSMPAYGRLSRRDRQELIDGARVEVAPYKRDPADFVLWKPSTTEQPGWKSPWGRGRPGWHIECSAMSAELLGEHFDIHGGGQDLIFPHHENELAQSVCAQEHPPTNGGEPFVNIWMHNGYVVAGGEKMSKSLGNFLTVRQLLEKGWRGEEIRLALLSAHYRQPLDFTEEKLNEAKSQLDRLYGALRGAQRAGQLATGQAIEVPPEIRVALEDDLNTPLALSRTHELAANLNMANKMSRKAQQFRDSGRLLGAGQLLGILQADPEVRSKARTFKIGLTAEAKGQAEIWPAPMSHEQIAQEAELSVDLRSNDDDEIDRLIAARLAARKAKNFSEADRIRDGLAAEGIILEDLPDGTTDWRRA